MSRRRRRRTNSNNQGNQRINNGLADVSAGLGALNSMTGGSFLSSYNTQAFSNNYSLLTLNRIILTYMYTGNGIFQTAVQLPIQDAIGKGIEIESGQLDNDDINKVLEYWEEKGIWTTILDYMTWVRLFGGGALLVNTNQDPEKPLSIKNLSKTELEFYDLDRWQLDTNVANFDDWESYINSGDQNEQILLYGQSIHESRFLRGKGKKAPHYVRRQLRGWGMSEGERMIRDLNLYLKTQDATFELIDEAKIDVYKIDGLAQKMMQKGGTASITSRIQTANEIKNYVNAIVLDAKEE
ncbi:MAG: anti-CBASS Acb1 family protein, partial [Maribacter sp.]